MKKIAIVGYGLSTLNFANLEVAKRLKQENIEVEFISPEKAEEITSKTPPKLRELPPKIENIVIEEKLFMPPTTRRERRANQRKNKN